MRPDAPTIAGLLGEAREAGVPRLDAHQLLARVTGQPRSWLIAHDDEAIELPLAERYRDLVARRSRGEPFAYLLGEREFHGLLLSVSPAVLIPRPDTETLVDWAVELLQQDFGPPHTPEVLDLGTGSGAIALAVKHAVPHCRVTALDASEAALQVAADNAHRLQLEVEFLHSDWWQAVAGRRWHLLLSNPPYIAEGDPHLTDLGHEPRSALTSGRTGLDDIHRIVDEAARHLHEAGWLLLEHGHDQAAAVRERLLAAGFDAVHTRQDLAGVDRCTGGRWRHRTAA